MPYILNKTNGVVLTTIDDASLDLTTNLTFVGRNYSGYGEIFNENFLHLLENFSNTSAPSKPVQGQLWFDSTPDNRKLNFCFDGKSFKPLATMQVQADAPSSPSEGDLWWDSNDNQLKAFDGSTYLIIGPQTSSAARSSWSFDEEVDKNDPTDALNPIIKGKVGSNVVLTIAKLSSSVSDNGVRLLPKGSSDLYNDFNFGVRKGITLAGADVNGSTKAAGYYFWGTAAESLVANTATNVTVSAKNTGTTSHYLTFVSTSTGNTGLLTDTGLSYNPTDNVLTTTASAARYGDLAEKYLADKEYSPGTVVAVGGHAEITACQEGDRAIGVVSENPGYMMNSELANGTYVALKGRVPVKVIGDVKSKDRLIAGNDGRARTSEVSHPDVFAVALTDVDSNGMVEAIVL